MKYLYILFCMSSFLQNCDLQKESDFIPLVPENTPFIVGVLEATNDTLHHYPEVFVGTVSNPEGFEAELEWFAEGIWWPITNALVQRPTTRNDLKRIPDTDAQVIIKGPVGGPDEKSVHFAHERAGVYGDADYQLILKAGGEYELKVTMGDGRKYFATTKIPESFSWEVPESLMVNLELGQFYTGGTQRRE